MHSVRRSISWRFGVALILLSLPATVSAQTVAFDATGSVMGINGGPYRIGVSFDVTDPGGIWIDGLGVFDLGSDGLAISHDVTLYLLNASGSNATVETPLTTATVPAGTSTALAGIGVDGGFRFVSLATPIFLPGGAHAAVVTYGLSNGFTDPYGDGFGGPPSGIAWAGYDPFDPTTATSGYPTAGDDKRHASASFLFTLGDSVAAPEPGALGLMIVGGVSLIGLSLRRFFS